MPNHLGNSYKKKGGIKTHTKESKYRAKKQRGKQNYATTGAAKAATPIPPQPNRELAQETQTRLHAPFVKKAVCFSRTTQPPLSGRHLYFFH
jgi:hypothetical protein